METNGEHGVVCELFLEELPPCLLCLLGLERDGYVHVDVEEDDRKLLIVYEFLADVEQAVAEKHNPSQGGPLDEEIAGAGRDIGPASQ